MGALKLAGSGQRAWAVKHACAWPRRSVGLMAIPASCSTPRSLSHLLTCAARGHASFLLSILPHGRMCPLFCMGVPPYTKSLQGPLNQHMRKSCRCLGIRQNRGQFMGDVIITECTLAAAAASQVASPQLSAALSQSSTPLQGCVGTTYISWRHHCAEPSCHCSDH